MRHAFLLFRLGVLGLWLCGVCLSARVSLAESPPARSDAANGEAEARYASGVLAYEEGRFRDAIESFKDADRLSPSARLSFNIAKVYERMGDNRNALASYREYVRRLPAAENEGEVSERIRELESSLAKLGLQQLSVLSVPQGATVLIDGVSRGVTPWTGELPPGPHRLALHRKEYQDATLNVELPATHAIDVSVPLVATRALGAAVTEGAPPNGPTTSESDISLAATEASLPSFRTWALFGGAMAASAASLGFEVSRRDMEDSARSSVQVVHKEKLEAMERRQAAARVFLGVGLVGVVAASISLYFDLDAPGADVGELAMDCDVSGCRVLGGGRF